LLEDAMEKTTNRPNSLHIHKNYVFEPCTFQPGRGSDKKEYMVAKEEECHLQY
jgi:hypothetical protein